MWNYMSQLVSDIDEERLPNCLRPGTAHSLGATLQACTLGTWDSSPGGTASCCDPRVKRCENCWHLTIFSTLDFRQSITWKVQRWSGALFGNAARPNFMIYNMGWTNSSCWTDFNMNMLAGSLGALITVNYSVGEYLLHVWWVMIH